MTANLTNEALVEELLKQLTLPEKVTLLSGRDSWNTNPIPRLNLPALTMTDGPHGVRTNMPDAGRPYSGPTTAFPTGVGLASSWNPSLVEEVGAALAEETLAAGCDILLGPCVNIVRTPLAGRNFEAYSEDPYLAGKIGAAYVRGLQSKQVGASLKHYAANNQEIERGRGSSEVDERTLREIYLPHFETVVKETQPWTVMCSYNRINGVYASQHHHLLNEILKEEWGFQGAVISDWGANHTITESVQGGLDIEMPGPAKYYGGLLIEAVNNWQIDESAIDRAARRVLRMIIRSGRIHAGRPAGAMNTAEHQALACKAAEESITLLKNEGGLLPIAPQRVKTMVVIGAPGAEMTISGGGSALVEPPYRSTPLAGLNERLGQQVEIRYEAGCDNFNRIPIVKASYLRPAQGEGLGLTGEYFANPNLAGEPLLTRVDPRLDFWWFQNGPHSEIGERTSIRWQGSLNVPSTGRYTLLVGHSANMRLFLDGRLLLENRTGSLKGNMRIEEKSIEVDLQKDRAYALRLEHAQPEPCDYTHIRLALAATPTLDENGHDRRIAQAVEVAREADLAVVFAGDWEGWETEGWDRPNLDLPGQQNALIAAVAAANSNTVVVLNTGAAVSMPWLGQVKAVVQAYYPGMEGGQAVARALAGEVNPSGKLTSTYPVRLEDTPSFTNLSYPGAREVHYGEGIFVGYRYYDTAGVQPLFPFGHGLSYTQFSYANLSVPETVQPGQSFEISLDVTNTGSRPGAEVVQVYVRDVDSSLRRPAKELKAFQKVFLRPGETRTVRVTLEPRALSFYDVQTKGWVAEPGQFEILAGSSSRDIRLVAGFMLS